MATARNVCAHAARHDVADQINAFAVVVPTLPSIQGSACEMRASVDVSLFELRWLDQQGGFESSLTRPLKTILLRFKRFQKRKEKMKRPITKRLSGGVLGKSAVRYWIVVSHSNRWQMDVSCLALCRSFSGSQEDAKGHGLHGKTRDFVLRRGSRLKVISGSSNKRAWLTSTAKRLLVLVDNVWKKERKESIVVSSAASPLNTRMLGPFFLLLLLFFFKVFCPWRTV